MSNEDDFFGNAASLTSLGEALRSSLSEAPQPEEDEEVEEVAPEVERKSIGRRISSFVVKGKMFRSSSSKEKKDDETEGTEEDESKVKEVEQEEDDEEVVVTEKKSLGRRFNSYVVKGKMFRPTSGKHKKYSEDTEDSESVNAALNEAAEVRAQKKLRDAEAEIARLKLKNTALSLASSKSPRPDKVPAGPSFAASPQPSPTKPETESPPPVSSPETPNTKARRKSQSLFSKDAGYTRPASTKSLAGRVGRSSPLMSSPSGSGKAMPSVPLRSQQEEEPTPEAYDILLHLADFAYRLEVNAAETDMLETIFQCSSENIYDAIASIRAAHEVLDNNASAGNKLTSIHAKKLAEVKDSVARNYAQKHVELPAEYVHEVEVPLPPPPPPALVRVQSTEYHIDLQELGLEVGAKEGGEEGEEEEEEEAEPLPSPAGRGRRLSVVQMAPMSTAALTELKDEIIGSRIGVRYDGEEGEECWSEGIVVDYVPELSRHEIIFEDGLRVDLDLSEETVRLEA